MTPPTATERSQSTARAGPARGSRTSQAPGQAASGPQSAPSPPQIALPGRSGRRASRPGWEKPAPPAGVPLPVRGSLQDPALGVGHYQPIVAEVVIGTAGVVAQRRLDDVHPAATGVAARRCPLTGQAGPDRQARAGTANRDG